MVARPEEYGAKGVHLCLGAPTGSVVTFHKGATHPGGLNKQDNLSHKGVSFLL